MKILWIDLNSSYAHSSLALPALHAQIMTDPSIEWEIVSATINENAGMIVDEIYHHQPDILAATTWLFNHEQLIHVASRVKALLPKTAWCWAVRNFWETMKNSSAKIHLWIAFSEEKEKKSFHNG